MKATLLHASQCTLGEGPVWHAERKCCFWVDIEKGILYEYNWISTLTRFWEFKYRVTLVMPGKGNQLVLALNAGIAKFDLETEKLEWLLDIAQKPNEIRCNDGACDRQGRLWVGTMHLAHKAAAGALYCVDQQLNVQKKIDHTTISNGLVWSLDNTRLYYIDSAMQLVRSFRYEESSGDIQFEQNVVEIPAEMGTPDGMTIDAEGMLWVAHWGGFGVYRWNPFNGLLLDKIEVPVPQVTSCTFAGDDLDHLVITTARENFTAKEASEYPESGNTFWIKTALKGVSGNICQL
ncbi:MAG: SMP-30/gluconolactonase/LRE family protein [Sphingobacteriaceae bacterium]